MQKFLDVQGHRGARGLKPENTLPAFEAALDLEVTSLEADIHLTSDGVPVVFHDYVFDARLVSVVPGTSVPAPADRPYLSELTVSQLRGYRVDQNPNKTRFPEQDIQATRLALEFSRREQIDPLTIPRLADLFAFVDAYAGELGHKCGKNDSQKKRARDVRFSLELKRVPFRPRNIGDAFDAIMPGGLETNVVEAVRHAGVESRTTILSFDHRAVRAARTLDARLGGAALFYNTVPVSIERVCTDADAKIYSPNYEFLDARQISEAHAADIRVVPWTVNDAEDMRQLIEWEVDGIITDFPDQLIAVLRTLHIEF